MTSTGQRMAGSSTKKISVNRLSRESERVGCRITDKTHPIASMSVSSYVGLQHKKYQNHVYYNWQPDVR